MSPKVTVSGQNSAPKPKIGAVLSPDPLREAVYQAERQVFSTLERPGMVDFFGSQLTIAPEVWFRTIDEIQTYVNNAISSIASDWPGLEPLAVRKRKGQTKAHYEFDQKTIAIPTESSWAMREMVVLHEIAHHLTWFENSSVEAHGLEYIANYLFLVSQFMGEEVALLLNAALDGKDILVTK